MPTFTAISLDRLLEAGAPVSIPPLDSKLKRTQSTTIPTTITNEKKQMKKPQWARVSPALYATPEAIPLPDSPTSSSYPPSPYIINHKRRGPRLLKSSLSVDNVSLQQQIGEDVKVEKENGKAGNDVLENGVDGEFSFVAPVSDSRKDVGTNGSNDDDDEKRVTDDGLGEIMNSLNSVEVNLKPETDFEFDDFFDPRETMSVISNTEVEDSSVAGPSCKQTTPIGDYFDACEELSSEGTVPSSIRDFESELREIRLNLLMEIERRKQTEEVLDKIQIQWQRLRQQLSLVGLTLPEAPTLAEEDKTLDLDPSEELCQQVHLARVVSNSIGRASAKAEVEMEMEAQIEGKDFEITRLADRLQYYEAMNHEMFQRQQEAIETTRRLQERRKSRQKWVWASIGATITLGSAALAWSYFPTAKGSDSTNFSHAPKGDD